MEEEKFCKTFFEGETMEMGVISLTYMPTLAQVTEITYSGTIKVSTVFKTVDLLVCKCESLAEITRHCIVNSLKLKLISEF